MSHQLCLNDWLLEVAIALVWSCQGQRTHTHTHTHTHTRAHTHTHTPSQISTKHTCAQMHTRTVAEWLICQSTLPIPAVSPPLLPARFLRSETRACKIGVYVRVCVRVTFSSCVFDLCNQSLFKTFCTPYHCGTAVMQNIRSRHPISLFYISAMRRSEFSWHVHFTSCWSDGGSWGRAGCWKGPWLVKPLGINGVTKDAQNTVGDIVADLRILPQWLDWRSCCV